MFRRKFLITAMLAAITLLAAPAVSQAAFSLQLSGGASTYTVNDQNSPSNVGPYVDEKASALTGVNKILVSSDSGGNYNGIQFELTTTTNNPGTAVDGNVFATTAHLDNQTGSGKTIVFTITSSGFTSPGQAGDKLYSQTELTLITGLTQSNLGTGAQQSSFTTKITGAGQDPSSVTTNPSNWTTSGTQLWSDPVYFTRGSDYTITSTYSVYIAAGARVDFQVNSVVAAPAPAGLVMFAGALPFFGLIRRRLRKSDVATVA